MPVKKLFSLLLCAAMLCSGFAMAYSADLPDGLTVIQEESFMGNKSLTGVVLHKGLEKIESRAFSNTGLESIYCMDISAIDIAEDAFDNRTFYLFPLDTGEFVIALGAHDQIAFTQYPPE